MIEFKRMPTAGGERLQAGLSEASVAAFVKTLAAEIDRAPAGAQLRWNGTAAVVVRESVDGQRVDQAAAVKDILAQAGTEARDIQLAVTTVKPAITSDSATLGSIKQLVATGSSKFAGSSPERVNNIQVAANKLDGVVIPPGTTFSFLTALGPITKANGYQEGLTILGDETVPGIGGGVCQVSTTVFRAAFFAGLPIVERHQHTYRVGYYEQDGSPIGFDAAVYDPGVDLRFKNDTEHAILMHAQVDAKTSALSFRFYSSPVGREVKLTPTKSNEIKAGPKLPDFLDPLLPKGTRKQLEWSADGADAMIRRAVVAGGQTLLSDAFFSRYVPWREKWAVGTG
jgi:vancomycin resistance protein YoaR